MRPQECLCMICADYGDRDNFDAMDRSAIDTVLKHGHQVLGIGPMHCGTHGHQDGEPYNFTLGMWHSYGQPELSLYGVGDTNMMTRAINSVADAAILSGRPMRAGDTVPGALTLPGVAPNKYLVKLVSVHPSWRRADYGMSNFFNRANRIEFLQILWPDRIGRYPDEPDFDPYFRDRQPLTWIPRDQHPPSRWINDDDGEHSCGC